MGLNPVSLTAMPLKKKHLTHAARQPSQTKTDSIHRLFADRRPSRRFRCPPRTSHSSVSFLRRTAKLNKHITNQSNKKGEVKKAQTAKKRTCRTKADINGQENKTVGSQAFLCLRLYAFFALNQPHPRSTFVRLRASLNRRKYGG